MCADKSPSTKNLLKKNYIKKKCHVLHVTSHVSLVTCYLSPVSYHMSPVTYHLSPTTYHLSPIICHCHQRLQPQPQTLPLLTNSPTMYTRLVHQDRIQKTHFPSSKGISKMLTYIFQKKKQCYGLKLYSQFQLRERLKKKPLNL